MTNREATKNLKKLKSFHNGSYGTAIDKAIKALEQEDVLDKIRAEIEDLTYYCWEISPRTVIDDVLEIIDKYRKGGAE